LAALDQDRRIEDEHDQELQAHQDRQYLDRKINLPVAQHRDDRHRHERVDPPGQVDTKILAEEASCGGGEQSVQADLHGVVAKQGNHRSGTARRLPQAARDETVEGSGAGVVAGHRGVANSEDQQDHAHYDICQGNTRAVAEQHGNGCTAGHGGERGSRRNHKEGNSEYPEAAMPQLLRVTSGDIGRSR
jgi:hypothetical protein